MLEKVQQNNDNNFLVFRNISTDMYGTGICYVSDGTVKRSRINKPFVTLYLQDVDNTIIPGYIFDIADFMASGLDLTKTVHSLVRVSFKENYLAQYGLTVILNKVELIDNPPVSMLSSFIGNTEHIREKYDNLCKGISDKVGFNVNLPYTICTLYHIDFNQGRLGGLVQHYWELLKSTEVIADHFRPDEQKQLYGTLLLYIYAHSNYISAEKKEEADINLVRGLTDSIAGYAKKLKLNTGCMEVVHVFFGYEPKDIYVRLILQTSKDLVRKDAEINLWKSLPVLKGGNAGYGTIKRYSE